MAFINDELIFKTSPPQHLIPFKDNSFRIKEFSDQVVEFIFDATATPTGFNVTDGGMTYLFIKKK